MKMGDRVVQQGWMIYLEIQGDAMQAYTDFGDWISHEMYLF
jgi:hypothetical protein